MEQCRLWLLAGVFALSGCAAFERAPQQAPEQAPEAVAPEVVPEDPPETRPGSASAWVMSGELALRRGNYERALESFARAIELTLEPDVAQRATEVALTLGYDELALSAAQRWVALAPRRTDARQVLVVLQLRAGDQQAARQSLATLLEHSGEGAGETLLALRDSLVQDVEPLSSALALLEELTGEYGQLAELHYVRAAVAHRAGELVLAKTAIDEARRLSPEWVDPLVLQARVLVARDEPDAAIAVMEQGLRDHPGDDTLRLAYGRLLFEMGREDEAQGELERLVEANPSQADAIRLLGLLALEQARFDDAHDYFMRLLQLGSHANEAYYYLGSLEMGQGNEATAMRWLSQVREGRHVLPARILLAEALGQTGNLAAARELLRQMREARPDARLALFEAEGQLLYNQGRYQSASELYDQALQEFSDNRTLLYGRALSLERLDRLDEVERDLRRMLAEDPDDPLALNALGYTLADRTTRYEEALGYIARALEQQPDNPAIIDSMGWVKYRLGEYEAAEQYLRRAYEMADDPEIAAHLGEVLWVTGHREEAREIWRHAMENFPDSDVLRQTVQRLKD